KILGMVNKWITSWQSEDINGYLSSYSKNLFFDDNRGDYNEFSRYKKAVFQAPGTPEIELKNLSIMMANDYAVVSFIQDYKASNLADVGKKLLYLKKDDYYDWKIVSEVWTKQGIDTLEEHETRVAFQPSMRFFKTSNPDQIMEIIPATGRTAAQASSN